MESILYTIGYEGLNPQEFLSKLRQCRISVVIDVRALPLSRKKGFSKTALSHFLHDEHIDYRNYPDLGADKELRDQLKKSGDYRRFFEKITQSISKHADRIAEIGVMLGEGKRVVLMCFEKNHELCHRKIVAEIVRKTDGNGLKIAHIS